MDQLQQFGVNITISRGWCHLRLHAGGGEVVVKSHWFADGFADLIEAVRDLVSLNRRVTSVRWAHEIAGGHFVDFVADPHGGVNVAVSQFAFDDDSSEPSEVWSARRGATLFAVRVDERVLATSVLDAARRVDLNVSQEKVVAQWRHSFPRVSYEALERAATVRFGYSVKTAEELGLNS